MFTGKASDYTRYIRERNKNVDGVSKWEQAFLKPLEESYKRVTTSASQSFDYDISSAFAAYKQGMMQSEMSNLWSGEKKGVASYLQSAYTSMFNKSLGEKYATFDKAGEAYTSAIRSEEERLNKVGSQFAKFERVAYDYIKDNIDFEFDPANKEQMAKYYDISTTGDITLNDVGRELWDKTLNSAPETIDEETGEVIKGQSLESYLYETNQDMYDFYQENIQDVREMVGGLDRDDFEYSHGERAETRADAIISNIDTTKVIGDLPQEFESASEKEEYYKQFENKVNAAKKFVVNADEPIYKNNEYSVSINGVDYRSIRNVADGVPVFEPIGYFRKYGITQKNNPYSTGDIMSFDGETYWIYQGGRHFLKLEKSSNSRESTMDEQLRYG